MNATEWAAQWRANVLERNFAAVWPQMSVAFRLAMVRSIPSDIYLDPFALSVPPDDDPGLLEAVIGSVFDGIERDMLPRQFTTAADLDIHPTSRSLVYQYFVRPNDAAAERGTVVQSVAIVIDLEIPYRPQVTGFNNWIVDDDTLERVVAGFDAAGPAPSWQ